MRMQKSLPKKLIDRTNTQSWVVAPPPLHCVFNKPTTSIDSILNKFMDCIENKNEKPQNPIMTQSLRCCESKVKSI